VSARHRRPHRQLPSPDGILAGVVLMAGNITGLGMVTHLLPPAPSPAVDAGARGELSSADEPGFGAADTLDSPQTGRSLS
jgi:hypothetical protein